MVRSGVVATEGLPSSQCPNIPGRYTIELRNEVMDLGRGDPFLGFDAAGMSHTFTTPLR